MWGCSHNLHVVEYIQEPVMGEVETKEKYIILHTGKSEVAKINNELKKSGHWVNKSNVY